MPKQNLKKKIKDKVKKPYCNTNPPLGEMTCPVK